MPTSEWPDSTGLIKSIEDEFFRFDFFQAMWVLEGALEDEDEKGPIIGERVRFRNSLSLRFPPSQIEDLLRSTPSEAQPPSYEVTPAFFGLTGLSGPLPRPYTEQLIDQEALFRDDSARAFFDIFSNRMLSLFFEAWKKHKLSLLYQRNPKRYFLPHVLSFVGARSSVHEDEQPAGALAPETLAFYSPTLTKGVVSVEDLEALLNQHFRVPMKVSQFLGDWVNLNPEYQASLEGGCRLGMNSFCGSRVMTWDKKLRISAGPLTKAQWRDFLPEGTARQALMEVLALTLGAAYTYELQLILKKEDVCPIQLNAQNPVRLGMDSFLMSRTETQDRGDACFKISSLMNQS
jgi:type VI secretion system protein ImpH